MGTPALRLRFPQDDGFHSDLKRRVASYFERTGTPPQGGRTMHVKTAAILGWFGASYALLLAFGGTAAWLAVALTVSLALATAGIGFSVMHDANHGAYSRSKSVNRAVGLALDLIGGSSYLWRFKHNVHHHSYANVDGVDTDIDAAPFLRFAPSQRWRAFHRWQGGYAWLLYGVLTLKWWLVDDVANVVRGRIGEHPFPRPRGGELAALAAGKAAFLGWALVVPALLFRSAWVAGLFVLGAFVLGLVLATVFQLAHTVAGAEFHAGADVGGRMPAGWAEHQVRATVDFAPSSRLLTWYLGGLNFQIEHHLFPGVCHVHYPALAPIVEETCRDHAIPYRVQQTLRDALAAHQRHLSALGRAPAPQRPGAPTDDVPGDVARLCLQLTTRRERLQRRPLRHGERAMRAIHLVATHVVAGVEPLCGRWDGMDTDWTTTAAEVTCPACVADIRLFATAGAAPVFGSTRVRWDS